MKKNISYSLWASPIDLPSKGTHLLFARMLCRRPYDQKAERYPNDEPFPGDGREL
jgi:hypothetical protein